jgi:GT2 family glycosyltransferase
MTAALSIVICNFNRAALLRECLASILRGADSDSTEIIVVDNASADDSAAMVRREFPSVRLLAQSRNLGFCVANNLGVAAATAPLVMLLNNDAVLLGDAAGRLVRYLDAHDDAKAVGPRIVLANGERQPRVFGNVPTLWRIAMQGLYLWRLFPRLRIFEGVDGGARPGPEDDVGWISGVCMLVRRADYLATGGFDPSFFMYCEDVDLCWRLCADGGRIVRLDDCQILHHGGGQAATVASQLRNSRLQQRNLLKIVRKRSGSAAVRVASLLIFIGLALRLGAGLALLPVRGVERNVLLRSSWLRARDLVRPDSTLPAG